MIARTKTPGENRSVVSASILSLLIVFLTLTSGAEAQLFNFGSPSIQPLGPRFQVNGFGPSVPFFFLNGPGIVGNGYAQSFGANTASGIPIGTVANSTDVSPTGQTTGNAVVDGSNVTINARGDDYSRSSLLRTSDSIEATIDKNDQLVIRWSGEPRTVRRVIVALLDKDRKALKQETITRLPVQAHLGLTSKTSYYRVIIEYVNGTSTSIVSPL